MANRNLTVDLTTKSDKNGKTFYIGRLKGPITIDCKDGISFLIFTSESGSEALQIAPMNDNANFDETTNSKDRDRDKY